MLIARWNNSAWLLYIGSLNVIETWMGVPLGHKISTDLFQMKKMKTALKCWSSIYSVLFLLEYMTALSEYLVLQLMSIPPIFFVLFILCTVVNCIKSVWIMSKVTKCAQWGYTQWKISEGRGPKSAICKWSKFWPLLLNVKYYTFGNALHIDKFIWNFLYN